MKQQSVDPQKTIAILGANGRLANEALQAFHQSGWQVIAVTRTGKVRNLPVGVKVKIADAMHGVHLKKAVRGVKFIFNGLNPHYTQWQHAALPIARNVMQAAHSTQAVHLFPGNVYNYGKTIPPVCDENTPFAADGLKARVRVEMEKLFATAAEKYAVSTLILRAGDFYGGTGSGSWFDQAIMDKLDKGIFTYPGPNDREHAWAYLPDLAVCFVKLAENYLETEEPKKFSVYHFPGHTLTGNELQAICEELLDKPLQRSGLPWKLIRIGGIIVPMWRELAEVAYLWERPHRLDGAKLQKVLGIIPDTEPKAAIHQTLINLGKLTAK